MSHNVIGRFATWWNARRDRAVGLPRPDAPGLSDFERRVVGAANAMIRAEEVRFTRAAHPLLAELDRHGRELELLEQPGFQYAMLQAGGRTDSDRSMSPGAHGMFLAVITIGEIFFNAQAFTIFGEDALMTFVMALAVGLGLPAVAYVLGTEIRQATWTPVRVRVWAAVLMLVVTTLAGITYVRSASITASAEALIADRGVDISYLMINALIFVAAVVVSYYSHDSVPGFVASSEALGWRQRRMTHYRGAVNAAVETFRARQDQIRQVGLRLISYYRAINRRGRQVVPEYFDNASHADCVPLHRFLDIAPERRD